MNAAPVIAELLAKPIRDVLIVGVHIGKEAEPFIRAEKRVTGVDLLPPYRNDYRHVRKSFEGFDETGFDALVCSHVLEHMPNIGIALRRMRAALKPEGWLGLVVPGYPQSEFFVGHLTLWTPALLLYNLVASGWDCREARYYTAPDRQHIGVLVQNRAIPDLPQDIGWDIWGGLKQFLPVPFKHQMNAWLPDHWG